MPGKVKVRILAGRNLPVMDRAADTTDAYVEVKLGNVTHKTEVYRKSLNPSWNSEWFRFEVDDHDLQDEPLQIRLMDHDTYSANDAIGKVYVDLNPLLLPPPLPVLGAGALSSKHLSLVLSSSSTVGVPEVASAPILPPPQPAVASIAPQSSGPAVMSGWLPVYDTMHGLRGEVAVVLKVDLFSDFNRFRQSSCGVHFFFSPEIPATFTCIRVVGLVEELVKNHDPEYEWIDKIRSPRASNEAKQTLFCKLSGMLQRKIGLKVLDMGGNAVLGYRQCFDLEGESGIVVRGLGTAVVLAPAAALTISGTNQHHVHHSSATVAPSQVPAFNHHFHHHHPHHPYGGCKQTSSPQGATSLHHTQQSSAQPFPVSSTGVTPAGAATEGATSAGVSTFTTIVNTKSTSVSLSASGTNASETSTRTLSVSAVNSPLHDIDITRPKSDLRADGDVDSSMKMDEAETDTNGYLNDEALKNTKWDKANGSDSKESQDRPSSKFTKQAAVDCKDDPKLIGLSSETNSRVWENFQHPAAESRKIQRTETVIEQEAIQTEINVETSFSLVAPEKCDSDAEAGVQTTTTCSSTLVRSDKTEPLVVSEIPSSTSKYQSNPAANDGAFPTVERIGPDAAENLPNGAPLATSECGSDIEDSGMRRGADRGFSDTVGGKGTSKRTWSGASSGNPFFSGAQLGGVCGGGGFVRRPLISHEALSMLKYPFFTMTNFPSGFVLRIGGTVSARCVKLLERSHAAPGEVESRDSWWAQLRGEVRMHCTALGCNVILGYTEFTSICDDVCVLNVSGTAAIVSVSSDSVLGSGMGDYGPQSYLYNPAHPHYPVSLPVHHYPGPIHHSTSFEKKDQDSSTQPQGGSLRGRQTSVSEDGDMVLGGSASTPHKTSAAIAAASGVLCEPVCCVCHSPFADATELPFKVAISKCALCKHGKVTDILLATIEPPPGIPITGRGCLVQARVFKHRRELKGEAFAKEVSDALPFVEYEITKIIINKVRIAGMNAIFGLRVRLSIGERLVVAVASGTAVYLSALPPPLPPQVAVDSSESEEVKREWQHKLATVMRANREFYGVLSDKRSQRTRPGSRNASELSTQSSDSEDEDLTTADLSTADADLGVPTASDAGGALEIDLSAGNKEACLLELDDSEDAEMADHLVNSSRPSPNRPLLATTNTIPGLPLSGDSCGGSIQMFTKVYRESFNPTSPLNQRSFNAYFDNVIESICFRVRKLQPCVITGLRFDVTIPEQDELQINVMGAIVKLPPAALPPAITVPLAEAKAGLDVSGSADRPVQSSLPFSGGKNQVEDTVDIARADVNGVLANHQTSDQNSQRPLEVHTNEIYDDGELIFKMEEVSDGAGKKSTASSLAEGGSVASVGRPSRKLAYASSSSSSCGSSSARPLLQHQDAGVSSSADGWLGVYISPLPFVPGARIERHLGNLNFFFIRESTCIKESGGVSVFVGSLVTEIIGVVRAHVAALGGNAVTSYFMAECILEVNPHKNQGQCLINVGGDVVQTSNIMSVAAAATSAPASTVAVEKTDKT